MNAGQRFTLDGGIGFYSGLVSPDGSSLEAFETSEYTVVGIYDVTFSGTDSIFDPGADELIVPLESIEARHGMNLVDCGPMTDATASFQIPNGGIDDFLKGLPFIYALGLRPVSSAGEHCRCGGRLSDLRQDFCGKCGGDVL